MARGRNGKSRATAPQIETRQLPVKLSDKVLLDRGDEMADCELRIVQVSLERSNLNDVIRATKKRRLELGRIIDSGAEEQDVKCEWRPDHAKAVWRLVRTDTQAEVETRTMTPGDMQTSIPYAGGAVPPVPPPRSPANDTPKRAPRSRANGTPPTESTAAPAPARAQAASTRRRTIAGKPALVVAPHRAEAPTDIVA